MNKWYIFFIIVLIIHTIKIGLFFYRYTMIQDKYLKKNIALIFSGRAYCYDDDSSIKYILNKINADTFVSLNHKISKEFIQKFNVKQYYDVKFAILKEFTETEINNFKQIVKNTKFGGGFTVLKNILSQYYHHQNNYRILSNYNKYDVIIYARTDIKADKSEYDKLCNFITTHDFLENEIHICTYHYGGICDQIAVGNLYSMKKYLNMYSHIVSILQSKTFTSQVGPKNAEVLLKVHLKNQGILIKKLDFNYRLNPNRNDKECKNKYEKRSFIKYLNNLH